MTVNELIQILSQLPKDQKILVNGYEGGFCDISSVRPIKVKLNVHTETYYGPHDDVDGADTEAFLITRIENH